MDKFDLINGPTMEKGEILSFECYGASIHIPMPENRYPQRFQMGPRNILEQPQDEWYICNEEVKLIEAFSQGWTCTWAGETMNVISYSVTGNLFEITDKTHFNIPLSNNGFVSWIYNNFRRDSVICNPECATETEAMQQWQVPMSIEEFEEVKFGTLSGYIFTMGDISIGDPNLHIYIPIAKNAYFSLEFATGQLGNDHLPIYPLTDEELFAYKKKVMMDIVKGIKVEYSEETKKFLAST